MLDRKFFAKLGFVLFIYIFLFSLPILDVPISDDYLYFEAVSRFVETNEINIPKVAAPSLLPQLFYSSAFAKIFGLTHYNMTVITIILSGASTLAAFVFFRKFVPEKIAFLGSLFFLFTPTFFGLTHTFMTDIHAFYFAFLSIVVLQKSFEKNDYKYILLATVFVVLSFLIRQWYVALPIGFAIFYLLNQRKFFLQPKIFTTVLIIPLLIFGLWFYWNTFIHGSPETLRFHLPVQSDSLVLANNFMKSIFFPAAFMFPFGFILLLNFRREIKKTNKFVLSIIILLIIVFVGWLALRYTYLGIVFPGNHVIFPYVSLSPGIPGMESELIWIPIIILGTLFIIFFLSKIFQSDFRKNFIFLMILFIILPLILPLLPTIGVKDRYYMLMIPLLLAFMLPFLKEFKFSREVLIISVIFLAAWSWYGTYNYLDWQDARRESLEYLLSIGGAKQVEGNEIVALKPYSIGHEIPENSTVLKSFEFNDVFGRKLGDLYAVKADS